MDNKPFIHLLRTPLNQYFYDVNTNQVVQVTEDVYNYLLELLTAKVNSSASMDISHEVDNLKSKGLLSTKHVKEYEHVMAPFLEHFLETNIKQMTLQVTQQCNFRCAYCSYTSDDFNSQRGHQSNKMSPEVMKSAIDFFADHSINQQKVVIGFYGGEPLLEFDLIQQAICYAEEILEGKELTFTITTNGSIFRDDILRFFTKHNISLMISLDGTPEFHDRSRKFAATGGGTYAVIEKNIRYIRDSYPSIYEKMLFNIVIDPRNSCDELFYKFGEDDLFKNSEVMSTIMDDFYSLEKVVMSEEYTTEIHIQEFKAYLARLGRYSEDKISKLAYKYILNRIERSKSDFKPFTELPDKASHSGPCIPGQRRLFVDVNGNFYPCERVSETSDIMNIGSLQKGFDVQKALDILNTGNLTEKECRNCWAFDHCSTCARFCDNNGEWSAELMRSRCGISRHTAEDKILDFLFYRELQGEL